MYNYFDGKYKCSTTIIKEWNAVEISRAGRLGTTAQDEDTVEN